jgi:hypothetical protein
MSLTVQTLRRTRIGSLALLIAMFYGCATPIPQDALRLPESTLEVRANQTRVLEAPSEVDILVATIAVLQDMEFNIDRIEKPLGVISASKVADADSDSEKAALLFLDMLCIVGGGSDCGASAKSQDDQFITLTMVVLPSLARSGQYSVRITIQRVVYDKEDRIRILERIDNAETYQKIFDNLRKSLYIQVNET